jgi:DnaK suppressor protein
MDETHARERLDRERARLLAVRAGLVEEHGNGRPELESISELSSYDQHEADVASETFEREKDESILERIGVELGEIDNAFARLDASSYGTCERCGRPIGDERLEAFPAARLCVEDQTDAERSGLSGRLAEPS